MEVEMNKWEIIYVPDSPPRLINQQPTVDVFASLIEPKLANTLVRRLNQIAPLENLRHVKRIRKNCFEGGKPQLSVILCLALESENQSATIPNDILELINAYQLSPFITKVAKYAALSKEEWEEQSKLWPTSYHPPTYNIDGITGFSEEDSQSIFNFMKFAIERAISGPCCDQVVNAAIIVDPSVRQVIANACDQTCVWDNPTGNTSLETRCCERVGDSTVHKPDSNGVVISEPSLSACIDDDSQLSYTGVSCLYPRRWTEQRPCAGSSRYWHPLRHAALVAIEYATERDRRLFPGSYSEGQPIQGDDMQSSSMSLPAKKQKTKTTEDDSDMVLKKCTDNLPSEVVRPYLCTGFDIYLVWEPCAMCAMALVHQRIRRIFYAFPNPNAGALGSVYRLQGEKSLNHHYAVFRVLLPEEILYKRI
ncbi:tRNA-specific adenosine deaminase TAD3 isoform X2 [Telopea speciosissima]|uniref:tRNA-specific adenosine deaminase TAD3 isoform X2 n=1 Tax=Telopea speciosissima TaxID=54955 RepID=UPI001CC59B20|nr:tRNA-specific adenosine deaminase TAD3 isoform X2 [Telopea speciosissima]